jgi:hypothetical protein
LRENLCVQDRYLADEAKGKRETRLRRFIKATLEPDAHDRYRLGTPCSAPTAQFPGLNWSSTWLTAKGGAL